jgi:ABC-type multidrug transport system ATPase subunit
MGSSGCGKTTLLSCVVGTKLLDSGCIRILNDDVGKNVVNIGYMPQDAALVEEFSIKELVYFFATIYGLRKTQTEDRFKFLMNLLELNDASVIIKNCSGGEKRRVSLAICLIHQPEILILDEPSVGLDPLLRRKIWDYFTCITKAGQCTIVITTHYIEEAKEANCVEQSLIFT